MTAVTFDRVGGIKLADDEIPLDNGKLQVTEGRKATGPECIGTAGLPKVGAPEQSVLVAGSFLTSIIIRGKSHET